MMDGRWLRTNYLFYDGWKVAEDVHCNLSNTSQPPYDVITAQILAVFQETVHAHQRTGVTL